MLITASSPDTDTMPLSHVSTAIQQERQAENQNNLFVLLRT